MNQKILNFIFYTLIFLLFPYINISAKELSYENHFKFNYFFLEAINHKQKNEHTQAFNNLQYALKFDSLSSSVLYELSKYYLFLKKEEFALVALQKAVLHNPKNFYYKIALADLNQIFGNYNETISIYEELLKNNQQNIELYYYLSDLYIKKKNINNAIEILNRIENNIGINELVSLRKVQIYKLIGNTNQALKEIELLAKKNPTDFKYQIFIGDFYLNKNDIEKALFCYKKSQTINPNNPYSFIAIFNLFEKKGDNATAMKEIEKALNNSTLDIETKLNILEVLIENLHINNENKKKIYSLFKTLLKQYPLNKKLNIIYGQFLLQQSRKENAKIKVKIVSKFIKKDVKIWLQLLTTALKEKNLDEIIIICNNALIYFPNVPEFYFYKGMAFSTKKLYNNALDCYLSGLKVISTDNNVFLSIFCEQIGGLYYQFGNKKKSFIFYKKAIQYNDKNIIAMNNYAYYLSFTENLDKAEKMASTVINIEPNNTTYIDTYTRILLKKKKYSLAKFYIENSIFKKNVINSEILEHYSNILYILGEKNKAVSVLWKKKLLEK